MKEYPYEIKFLELVYIGETNEHCNNLEKYWMLISNVTGPMCLDNSGELISCKIEEFVSVSDFRDEKLKELGL